MSDQTNQEREAMARDLAGDANRRALDLARQEGARQATVDGRLNSHEERLAAINGSIRRHAESVEALSQRVAELVQEQRTKNALEIDRAKALKQANERQISTRTFILGVLTILIALLAIFIQLRGGR